MAVAALQVLGSKFYIAGIQHQVTEVEIYCYSQDHPDPFVHCVEEQRQCGTFYFHRKGAGYREGTFKGLDITAGRADLYCGILVRSLVCVESGELFTGPSCVVDRILRLCQVSSVTELVEQRLEGNFSIHGNAWLQLRAGERPSQIYTSPRIGLYLTVNAEERAQYVLRPYRFISEYHPKMKGQLHTAFGLWLSGNSPEQVMGFRRDLKDWVTRFQSAKSLQEFIGRRDLNSSDLADYFGAILAALQH